MLARPVLLLAVLSVSGCSVDPVTHPEKKRCPCAEGWTCDTERDQCVRQLAPKLCSVDAECDGTCELGTCVEGVCPRLSTNTAGRHQTPFDCTVTVCDERGLAIDEVDPADFWDDGNECTIEACTADGRTVTFAPDGSPCTAGGGRLCLGGACVECIEADNCPTTDIDCIQNRCVFPFCGDGEKQESETDIDCGWPVCPPCGAGKHCNQDVNCASGICEGEVCVESCSDAVKNGNETDIDCGGGCSPCALYGKCLADTDCASGECAGVCL